MALSSDPSLILLKKYVYGHLLFNRGTRARTLKGGRGRPNATSQSSGHFLLLAMLDDGVGRSRAGKVEIHCGVRHNVDLDRRL